MWCVPNEMKNRTKQIYTTKKHTCKFANIKLKYLCVANITLQRASSIYLFFTLLLQAHLYITFVTRVYIYFTFYQWWWRNLHTMYFIFVDRSSNMTYLMVRWAKTNFNRHIRIICKPVIDLRHYSKRLIWMSKWSMSLWVLCDR